MAFKAGGDGELNAEINVTPLVDVMLVLLIIFMITAPMMNTGVELQLPQVTANTPEDANGPLILSIKQNNTLYLSGTQIQWRELAAKIKANTKVQSEHRLYIEADAHLAYSVVVTAMAVVKDNGVASVMLVTNPTDNLKLDDLDSSVQNTGH
jgi:biopolymer transport protein TolR